MNVRPLEVPDARTVEIEGNMLLRVPWKGGPQGISGPQASFLEIETGERYGQGCASGRISRKLEPVSEIRERSVFLKLCPQASRDRTWARWRVDFDAELRILPPAAIDFETSLASDGAMLLVRARDARADIRLPRGPFADEVRRHPELLALVVLAGFVPRSATDRYELAP